MKSLEREAAHMPRAETARAEKVMSSRQAGALHQDKEVAEKPKASEEIVIEEISIDGMCGVY